MGAVLLTAGTKGKRFALPNSRTMLHQPMGGFEGPAAEVEIHAREILRIREELNLLLANHTGQPIEKIRVDTDRDFFMGAEESVKYGLIDEVVQPKSKSKVVKKAAG